MGTTIEIETDTAVSVGTEELSRIVGNQIVVEGDHEPFGYLVGLALDGLNGYGDAPTILVEFLENEELFDLDEHEIEMIEQLLEDSYDG